MSKSRNRNLAELIDGTGVGTSSLAVYATKENLPYTGLTQGDQAYVLNTSRFYISNGSGWYNVALVNANPALTISPSGTIELSREGTATTITLTGTDSDNAVAGLTFSVESDGDFFKLATLSQDSSVFTITPRSKDSATSLGYDGTSTLTFKASDGVSFGTANSILSLSFSVQYSNYTQLLLQADDASTDTQVDASSNTYSLTKYGTPTSTAHTPYHPGGYSYYFDGTGDWLTVANGSSQMVPEAGDFTVEFWFYVFNASSRMDPYSSYTGTSGFGIILNYSSGGTVATYHGNTITNQSAGSQFSAHTWNHLAVSRSGTTTKIFINGTAIHTNASDNTDYDGTATLYMGVAGNETQPYTGYLRDIRFVKGTAVYTSNFTAPDEPLTAITNTKLLTCHLPYLVDGSADNNTITISGNTRIYRFTPYDYLGYTKSEHGGSSYFDGNGDYYIAPFSVSSESNTTIEAWIFMESISSHNIIYSQYPNANASSYPGRHFFYVGTSDNKLAYWVADDGTAKHSQVLQLGIWYHVAVVKSGNTIKLYVNGKGETSGITFDRAIYNENINLAGEPHNSNYFEGYITDLRVNYNSTTYTSDFTPPTAPLTSSSDTKLLTFTNKNDMWNAAGRSSLITLSGVAASTTQRKFNTSDSFYFNGSNSYLQISNVDTIFKTKDFTIEVWVYMTSVTGSRNIYDGRGSANQAIPTIYVNSGTLYYYVSNANRIDGGSLSADTWYHIAVARTGTSTKMFVNGTQVGSTYSDSTDYARDSLARSAYWGNYAGNLGGDYIGYMQNMRITKGLARYTANFTPPTADFEA